MIKSVLLWKCNSHGVKLLPIEQNSLTLRYNKDGALVVAFNKGPESGFLGVLSNTMNPQSGLVEPQSDYVCCLI